MSRAAVVAGLFLALASNAALGQQAPPPAGPRAPAAPPETDKLPLTLENLQVKPEELPNDIRIVQGIHPIKPFEGPFFAHLEGATFLPRAKGKAVQSLAAEGQAPGSVFLLEYEGEVPVLLKEILAREMWGDSGKPTAGAPEELFVQGRFLVLLSFPLGERAPEWFKERMRKRLGIPTMRQRPAQAPLVEAIQGAYEKRDHEVGLKLLDMNADFVKDWSYGQYMRGEFCLEKLDFAGEERSYGRALELNDSLDDPLEDRFVWAALDGLGFAQHKLGKLDAAVATLKRARDFADARGLKRTTTSVSTYELAKVLAHLGRFDESLVQLRDAIGRRVGWKKEARTAAAFAEARKRPDFQALLKE
jgi:hypothetical protein